MPQLTVYNPDHWFKWCSGWRDECRQIYSKYPSDELREVRRQIRGSDVHGQIERDVIQDILEERTILERSTPGNQPPAERIEHGRTA